MATRAIRRRRGRHFAFVATVVVLAIVGAVAGWHLVVGEQQYAEAVKEYDELREAYRPSIGNTQNNNDAAAIKARSTANKALLAINPNYVGWLQIPGTGIDYPVVKGKDNDKYLHTTFTGVANPSGSIFMNSANTANFDDALTILYGHNMRNGSMFAELNKYQKDDFLTHHSSLTVTTLDGHEYRYQIVKAKLTSIYDPAYSWPLFDGTAVHKYLGNVNQSERTVLMLSTCTSSSDDTERMLVFAQAVD